jgi:hypothetical protein
VRLEWTGQRQPLPGGVEFSVYRVVQEALMNVLKHAYPTRVTVTLAFRDSRLDAEVVDDGTTAAHGVATTGRGLGELSQGDAWGHGRLLDSRRPRRYNGSQGAAGTMGRRVTGVRADPDSLLEGSRSWRCRLSTPTPSTRLSR